MILRSWVVSENGGVYGQLIGNGGLDVGGCGDFLRVVFEAAQRVTIIPCVWGTLLRLAPR
jgi:hypothetical protein